MIIGSIGGIIGCATAVGWWKLYDIHRRQMERLSQPSNPAGSRSHASSEKPPTLPDLFHSDFSATMVVHKDDHLTMDAGNGRSLPIETQLYLDFNARTKFIGFYVPLTDPVHSEGEFRVCLQLVNEVQPSIDLVETQHPMWAGYRDQTTNITDLVFSGRVMLYYMSNFSITQKAEIIKAFKDRNYDVQFRGPDYFGDQLIAWHHKHDAAK
jgi:hypothetical protein